MKQWPIKKKYDPDFCSKLTEHMASGMSAESFGAVINCGKSTVFTWIEKHEEFAQAYEEGKARSLQYYERLLALGASGAEHKTTDGKTLKPNAAFVNFALSRRWRNQYSEKVEHEQIGEQTSRLIIDMGEDKEPEPKNEED